MMRCLHYCKQITVSCKLLWTTTIIKSFQSQFSPLKLVIGAEAGAGWCLDGQSWHEALLVGRLSGVVSPELEANSTFLDFQDGEFLDFIKLTYDSDSVKEHRRWWGAPSEETVIAMYSSLENGLGNFIIENTLYIIIKRYIILHNIIQYYFFVRVNKENIIELFVFTIIRYLCLAIAIDEISFYWNIFTWFPLEEFVYLLSRYQTWGSLSDMIAELHCRR